jgi:hypothetical protein
MLGHPLQQVVPYLLSCVVVDTIHFEEAFYLGEQQRVAPFVVLPLTLDVPSPVPCLIIFLVQYLY